MNIAVILTGSGGELARETFVAREDDADRIDDQASRIIDSWVLSVGDTITIAEVR